VASKLKKLEEIIFYLLILLLPTQLGLHFWPSSSYVYGLRIDYLSPTIYCTDLLIALLLLTLLTRSFLLKKLFKKGSYRKRAWIFVWLFVLICGIVISKSPSVGIYGLIKIAELVFFGSYCSFVFPVKNMLKNTIRLLSIGVIYEGALAIAQSLSKSSLNGPLYFLGERSFNGQTPGIANASLAGQLILRPYATFSHPNMLAAFLLISMSFILFFIFKETPKKSKGIYLIALAIGSFALALTMSRVAILLYSFLIITIVVKKYYKQTILLLLAILLVVIIFSPIKYRFINLSLSDLSVVQRQELMSASLLMFKNNPILGVGVNNFLINLPLYEKLNEGFYLQPVHNIYLLVLSQTGIIGAIFFTWFLGKTFYFFKKQKNNSNIIFAKTTIFIIVLALGFFDHYFLTLQQGQLLAALAFGFLWTDTRRIS
jgi:O-antigen ligase